MRRPDDQHLNADTATDACWAVGMSLFGKRKREQKAAEQRLAEAADEARRTYEAWEWSKLEHHSDDVQGVVLKRGEIAYAVVEGVALVEPRREPGRWAGGSHGVSFRIAKGLTYRVGQQRGKFEQGQERPTVTDTGTFVVTNQRCVFVGSKRNSEWLFSKMLGFALEGDGTAFFSVQNRQKVTGVAYGTEHEARLDAIVSAAIARFRSPEDHAELIREFEGIYREWRNKWEALNARSGEPLTSASPSTAPKESPAHDGTRRLRTLDHGWDAGAPADTDPAMRRHSSVRSGASPTSESLGARALGFGRAGDAHPRLHPGCDEAVLVDGEGGAVEGDLLSCVRQERAEGDGDDGVGVVVVEAAGGDLPA
jgi:hypothetical protein